VAKGTKVKFNWTGNNSHNVTKKRGPGGGFASPTTSSSGINFTKKFKKAGTYKLICTIHPDTMKMKLEVG
jgi:plastocyanin